MGTAACGSWQIEGIKKSSFLFYEGADIVRTRASICKVTVGWVG
jgi:hypothetical protein